MKSKRFYDLPQNVNTLVQRVRADPENQHYLKRLISSTRESILSRVFRFSYVPFIRSAYLHFTRDHTSLSYREGLARKTFSFTRNGPGGYTLTVRQSSGPTKIKANVK